MRTIQEVVLTLARAVRAAETTRIADGKRALDRYDEALHGRLPTAADYLKSVKRADDRYQDAVGQALSEYADTIGRLQG